MRPFFKLSLILASFILFLTNNANADNFFCENQKINYKLPDGFCKFNRNIEFEKEFIEYMDKMIGKPVLIELAIRCKTLDKIRNNNYEYKERELFPSITIASDIISRKENISVFKSIPRKKYIDLMEKVLGEYSSNSEAEKLKDKVNEERLKNEGLKVSEPKMSVLGKDDNSLFFVAQVQNHYKDNGVDHSVDSYSISFISLIKTYPIYVYLNDSDPNEFNNNLNLLRNIANNIVTSN